MNQQHPQWQWKYVLNKDGEPVPEPDEEKFWQWWMKNDGTKRRIEATSIDGKFVSTVFLGLNHQYGKGPPILYETMVFGDGDDYYDDDRMRRYSTKEEALRGHAEIVEELQKEIADRGGLDALQ